MQAGADIQSDAMSWGTAVGLQLNASMPMSPSVHGRPVSQLPIWTVSDLSPVRRKAGARSETRILHGGEIKKRSACKTGKRSAGVDE